MATRATYRFVGFGDCIAEHFYKHHDNYPAGTAEVLWQAACKAPASVDLQSAFIDLTDAESIDGHERHSDTDYRYDLKRNQLSGRVTVDCWRKDRRDSGDVWELMFDGNLRDFIKEFRVDVKSEWL